MINKKLLYAVSLAVQLSFSGFSQACLTSELESNDKESNANTDICSGVLIEGDMSRGDIDWFKFNVTEAGNINITLAHNRRDDFDWDLYQGAGSAIASGTTSNTPEFGSYNTNIPGEYYVKVTRYSGRGWYDLTLDYPESTGGGGGSSCEYGTRPSKPGSLKTYITANSEDACETLEAGAVLLMGGGTDVDQAFSNRVRSHVGDNKDVVILRTDDSDGYNDYLLPLMNADSVETLIVNNSSKANSDYVEWAIKSAEFVFVAGGDQSEYINVWEGTKVQSALQHVYDKGGVVGGTSAGMALMASSIYDPDGVLGAISEEVVTDLCHETLNFSASFINIPVLTNMLTDTHFTNRDRMGRAMVSLANHSSQHAVIAADEGTSIFIN
ncbi:cyanophycinase, partial [Pseudoalteromonas sp. NBT06-2]|uniref:Type 1 glutamine amidotransferase-like domain-containing protein n=1 Tax=Pseudoalteromonas sp. NBT06-2 TaxID=2025950 RepID=UPI000BA6B5D2